MKNEYTIIMKNISSLKRIKNKKKIKFVFQKSKKIKLDNLIKKLDYIEKLYLYYSIIIK